MKYAKRITAAACIAAMMLQAPVCHAEGLMDSLLEVVNDVAEGLADNEEIKEGLQELEGLKEMLTGEAGELLSSLMNIDLGSGITKEVIDTICEDVVSLLDNAGENAEEKLEGIYLILTEKVGVVSETAEEWWNSIMEYANENEIDPVVAGKMAIASVVNAVKEEGFKLETAPEQIKKAIDELILTLPIHGTEEAEEVVEELIEQIEEE